MMWKIVIDALLKQLEENPDRVLIIVQDIIGILKTNPEILITIIQLVKR